MEIIKEVFINSQHKNVRFIIRTNTYSNSLFYFNTLFEEAKKDFPDIKPDDVEIIHYGGRRYKGTFGIEWSESITIKRPKEYREISNTEYTL